MKRDIFMSSKKFKGAVISRLGDILSDSDGILILVKLNILFLITWMPIVPPLALFTAGSAMTALSRCTNMLVKTGYVKDVKDVYISAYKESLKNSMKYGFVITLSTIVLTFGLYFYLVMAGVSTAYIPFASVSLLGIIFIWAVATHLFPTVNINEDKSFKENISIAASIAIEKLKKTLIAVIISLVFIAGLILFLPASLPLLLTLGFSVPALRGAFAHTEPEFV